MVPNHTKSLSEAIEQKDSFFNNTLDFINVLTTFEHNMKNVATNSYQTQSQHRHPLLRAAATAHAYGTRFFELILQRQPELIAELTPSLLQHAIDCLNYDNALFILQYGSPQLQPNDIIIKVKTLIVNSFASQTLVFNIYSLKRLLHCVDLYTQWVDGHAIIPAGDNPIHYQLNIGNLATEALAKVESLECPPKPAERLDCMKLLINRGANINAFLKWSLFESFQITSAAFTYSCVHPMAILQYNQRTLGHHDTSNNSSNKYIVCSPNGLSTAVYQDNIVFIEAFIKYSIEWLLDTDTSLLKT